MASSPTLGTSYFKLLYWMSFNSALLFVFHLRPLVPFQADIPTSHLSVEGLYLGDHAHHCMYPELLVSSLVLEPLQDNETLLIKVSAGNFAGKAMHHRGGMC